MSNQSVRFVQQEKNVWHLVHRHARCRFVNLHSRGAKKREREVREWAERFAAACDRVLR